MQKYAIVLGGLETGYMRKLALYFKGRLDMRVQVEISEKSEPWLDVCDSEEKIWVGSKEFIRAVQEHTQSQQVIILGEEDIETENQIFRYQSCEKIYRGILAKSQRMQRFPSAAESGKIQNRLVVTTDGSAGELLAFSMICAQVLGKNARVLYVNLSECCGMEELFCLERDRDLSDLFLEMRRGKEIHPEAFIRTLEYADYLMPVSNPMILHEINEEDMEHFLELLNQLNGYEWIVFALGNTLCGCEKICAVASRIFHLSGNGMLHACERNAWMTFLYQCLGNRQLEIEQIAMMDMPVENCGRNLIDDWLEGVPGQIVERYLGKR